MNSIDQEQLRQALGAWRDPCTDIEASVSGVLRKCEVVPAGIRVHIQLAYPAAGLLGEIKEQLQAIIQAVPGVEESGAKTDLTIDWAVRSACPQEGMHSLAEVRNIIAVASGKGGVGKSFVAANLALALAAEGAQTGLLDADIYGPSQQLMLGIAPGQRPETRPPGKLVPLQAHGLQLMSMGCLITERAPMVWRGPMVSGALQQLVGQTLWKGLDYLVVDMPPGTGDVQLTLAQKVPVAGAVVVTTPQDLATQDACKGIEMFRKVGVAVLGVVENMGLHTCPSCGHEERLFGDGGGEQVARDYGIPLLGSLPLDASVREQTDRGCPAVAAAPESEMAMRFREIARGTAAMLAEREPEPLRRIHAVQVTPAQSASGESRK